MIGNGLLDKTCQAIDNQSMRTISVSEVARMGGLVRASAQRSRALALYYARPLRCKSCGAVIEVGERKVTEIKHKKFCNRSCAASFNNRLHPKRARGPVRPKMRRTGRVWLTERLPLSTKGELFRRCKNWQSARTIIRMHAAYIFHLTCRPKLCTVCAYSIHVDVCHKRAVSEFSDESLIGEINHPDNLVSLCKNHHWELDHGLLRGGETVSCVAHNHEFQVQLLAALPN